MMRQILTPQGDLVDEPPIDVEFTRRLYRAMVVVRTYDRKCSALQRQGRLATYSPFEGQEAAQVGSAAALEPEDWMVATYRDAAAMWMQGYPMELLIAGRTGDERGGSPPAPISVLPPSITVGGHMIHAVGLAWASRLLDESRIAITYFGDGATSEGDFHEAMNFAAVYETGVVFFCQNNQYAISLPLSEQTRSDTIAQKAAAYGMAGIQVDGNDLLAVFDSTRQAVERARAGDGPTLIEALTYRIGPHTTADDPSRYRPEGEVEEWRRRDPLERLRLYLERQDAWSPEWEEGIESEASAMVEEAVAAAESIPEPESDALFQRMFDEPTATLLRQRTEMQGGGS